MAAVFLGHFILLMVVPCTLSVVSSWLDSWVKAAAEQKQCGIVLFFPQCIFKCKEQGSGPKPCARGWWVTSGGQNRGVRGVQYENWLHRSICRVWLACSGCVTPLVYNEGLLVGLATGD